MPSLDQHNREIQENKLAWEQKPLLREIYADFYTQILSQVRTDISGKVVELGSGIGNFKSIYPSAIATDLFPNPWIDQVENAYHLSFTDGSVANLVLFDVFHHLEYPGLALAEFRRALAPGGRVIIFEPAISLLGYIVYGLFHSEPVALFKKIHWLPTDTHFEETYYAAQGNATRVFGSGSSFAHDIEKTWCVVKKRKLSALSYVLSGGFSRPALYPTSFLPILRAFEKILIWLPILFATRLLIVLEKK